MNDLRAQIEQDRLFFDSAVVAHGYAPYMRDYDIVIDVPAATPDGQGSYIVGRYRYRFSHCPYACVVTSIPNETWKASWEDVFIDVQRWEQAGNPGGFLWGVRWADAYPGLSYVDASRRANEWADRLGYAMHEVEVKTNTFELRLVAHALHIEQLAAGSPEKPLESPPSV